MTLDRNGLDSAPDGPPLASIERQGSLLQVTVLHPAAADLLWRLRERLSEVHGCTSLRLTILGAAQVIELQWTRPLAPAPALSVRRG